MSKAYRPLTVQDGIHGKECYVCGKWKPTTCYGRGGYDGLDHRCNDCRRDERESKRTTPLGDIPRQTGYAILRYEGAEIAFELDRTQASLTDLWVADGRITTKEPKHWLAQDGTKALLAQYASGENVRLDYVCVARPGAHGGTWAPREIALAYAMYLNPALHLAVLRFVLERSDEFLAASRGATPDQSLALMQQLIAPIYQRLGILDLLPGIDRNARAAAIGLAGAELIKTREIWNGRVYVVRITNPHHIAIVRRKFVEWPGDRPHLLAVGQTGPDGDLHQLRLKDYAGKFGLEPDDYEVLAEVGSDEPSATESWLLVNPFVGCIRLRVRDGQKIISSRTFLAADDIGVELFQSLPRGYCPMTSIKVLVPVRPPPGQVSMF